MTSLTQNTRASWTFWFLIVWLCSLLLCPLLHAKAPRIVNIYSWAYVLTPEIIHQFEKETDIKVNYDVYDSAEVMETKLFAGHSGYDLVLVTVWPYFARQLEAHIYQPLQSSLIPNKANLDIDLLKRMAEIDPSNQFAIPLIWGTTGFAINKKMISERFPQAPTLSLAMLFVPAVVAHFADCGVMLLDSPVDVFPAVLKYLKKNPNSDSLVDLQQASQTLTTVKPLIKKFQAIPSEGDILSGGYCIVEGYSGELLLAQQIGKESGIEIDYIIPEEGTALWIDALAIPIDAIHVNEANSFINFLLRPDIIAQITNAFETANSIPASFAFTKEIIRTNPLIYPSKETLEKLYIDKIHTPRYERLRLREWTRVKIGR